jgi:hypothetical protein
MEARPTACGEATLHHAKNNKQTAVGQLCCAAAFVVFKQPKT